MGVLGSMKCCYVKMNTIDGFKPHLTHFNQSFRLVTEIFIIVKYEVDSE